MRAVVGSVLVTLLGVAGCTSEKPKGAEAVKAAPAEGHAAADEHAHPSPHGGWVQSAGGGHLELLVDATGTWKLWLLDDALKALPVAGASAKVRPSLPGAGEVALSPAGDHLAGAGPAPTARTFSAIVRVVAQGKGASARFAIDLDHPPASGDALLARVADVMCLDAGDPGFCTKGLVEKGNPLVVLEDGTKKRFRVTAAPGKTIEQLFASSWGQRVELRGELTRDGNEGRIVVQSVGVEHEHSAHQGGAVTMFGDLHLEVSLVAAGEVRVHLSDAFRRPLPAVGRSGTATVTVDGKAITAPLLPSADGAYLSARVPALGAREYDVRVAIPMAEDPSWSVSMLLKPTSSDADAAAGAHGAHTSTGAPANEVVIVVRGGYSPERIEVPRGKTTKLRFVRKDSGDCSDEVQIPALGVRTALGGLGSETVVEVTPTKAGDIEFTCGMDMLRGTLVVR